MVEERHLAPLKSTSLLMFFDSSSSISESHGICFLSNVWDTLASMGCGSLTIMRRKQNDKINSVTEEIDSVYV